MDTHGHQKVAAEIGEPILKKALGDSIRLESFYMGNWLTDVSQLIDPVVVPQFLKSVEEKVDDISKKIFKFQRDGKFGKFFHEKFDERMTIAKNELIESLKVFAGKGNETRESQLQECVRLALRINGYFKFSHPEEGNGNFRLDPEIYFRIFNERYTQYYPHEHVDRPELLGSESKRFAYTKESPGDGNPSPSRLYRYLKDDLLLTSGLLAEVDQTFSNLSRNPVVNNEELHLTLAKLGHALHGVEDFFAHSNFVENAFMCMETKFLEEKKITAKTGNNWLDKIFFSTGVIFEKRLRGLKDGKYPTPEEETKWRDFPEETHVVTGYFDSWDTFFSISAVVLDILGLAKEDPSETYYKAKNYIASKKWLKDTMEVITDYDQSVKDKDNVVAQECEKRIKDFKKKYSSKSLADRYKINEEIIDLMLSQDNVFKKNDKITNDIRSLIRLLSSPPKSLLFVQDAITYYKLLKNIGSFFHSPVGWFYEMFKDLFKDQVKDIAIFYSEELAYNLLNRYRVGSHSLLAKDHANDRLFTPMFNCSAAIHFYVVDNMTRWFSESWKKDSRTDKPIWIDWQELIEYFLRHPASEFDDSNNEEELFIYTLTHIVKNDANNSDTLASLADQYRGQSYYGVSQSGDSIERSYPYWKAIADANWGISEKLDQYKITDPDKRDELFKQLINQILKQTKTGNLITSGWAKGNYALKNNIPVLIPFLVKKRKRKKLKKMKEKWFYDVLQNDSWDIFKRENDRNVENQYFKNKYHTLKAYKEQAKQDAIPPSMRELIYKSKQKRKELQDAYSPSAPQKKLQKI